jgi:nucleotide-binding universal stress UspA family protein
VSDETTLLSRIVVGTDGSDTAGLAVREAVDLAVATRAALDIVTVQPGGEPSSTMAAYESKEGGETLDLPVDVPRPTGQRGQASAVLDAAAAAAGEAGVAEIGTHALEGEPADAIIDFAERVGADLIVVGNKGMTGARRFLLGSVPDKITHHAPCSVLVVRTTG